MSFATGETVVGEPVEGGHGNFVEHLMKLSGDAAETVVNPFL
jgi:hypothetical protein